MKDKLIHLLGKYGNDFFHKLPKYKTAKYKDKFVSISYVTRKLTAWVTYSPQEPSFEIDVFELDEFVLWDNKKKTCNRRGIKLRLEYEN